MNKLSNLTQCDVQGNMDNTFVCLLISLQAVIVVAHIFTLYLLFCVHQNEKAGVQEWLVANLSTTAILINVLFIFCSIRLLPGVNSTGLERFCVGYRWSIVTTLMYFSYYLSMFYIVINKLLEVRLSIRHPVYCNTTNVKYLLAATWTAGLVICILVNLTAESPSDTYYMPIVISYVFLDAVFICTAVTSSGYIFKRFRQSRIAPTAASGIPAESFWKVFRNSRFYVSVVLVVTFIIFTVIPSVIWMVVASSLVSQCTTKKFIFRIVIIQYRTSFLADSLVYILTNTTVRSLLIKKINLLIVLLR